MGSQDAVLGSSIWTGPWRMQMVTEIWEETVCGEKGSGQGK